MEQELERRMTKRDMIVEELRALIASGELSRGARVQQDELAVRFGTSITPVREALLLLEAEGVLVGEPHRGVRVASADPEKLKANYILRRLAECHAMQRASLRMSRLDLDGARRLVDDMKEAHKSGDQTKVGETNRTFHFLFYNRCGIPDLTRQIGDLWLSFPWDILQVLAWRTPESIKEHQAMLEAVESGDLDAVEAATAAHLANGHIALIEHLTADKVTGDPFDVHLG